MWWPSFCSVMHDLWGFVWYGESESRQSTVSVGMAPSLTVHSLASLHLLPNTRYTRDHPTTKAIRTHLKTEASLKLATADLSPFEWLAYLYTKTGRPLPWQKLALAPVGYWHQLLEGVPNITINPIPKTQSLMEWHDDIKHGHIGYITKVTPDETITVQELGGNLPGVFTEQIHLISEWREWHPVFICVA